MSRFSFITASCQNALINIIVKHLTIFTLKMLKESNDKKIEINSKHFTIFTLKKLKESNYKIKMINMKRK